MPKLHPTDTVAANFRRVVPKLVRRYFARGRRLVRREASDARLHRFRIRTKRMRYILELYAETFPREIGGSLKHFQKVQEMLGRLQDQHMFHAFVDRHAAGSARDALLRDIEQKQARLRSEFFRGWKKLEQAGIEKDLVRRVKGASGPRRHAAGRRTATQQPPRR